MSGSLKSRGFSSGEQHIYLQQITQFSSKTFQIKFSCYPLSSIHDMSVVRLVRMKKSKSMLISFGKNIEKCSTKVSARRYTSF